MRQTPDKRPPPGKTALPGPFGPRRSPRPSLRRTARGAAGNTPRTPIYQTDLLHLDQHPLPGFGGQRIAGIQHYRRRARASAAILAVAVAAGLYLGQIAGHTEDDALLLLIHDCHPFSCWSNGLTSCIRIICMQNTFSVYYSSMSSKKYLPEIANYPRTLFALFTLFIFFIIANFFTLCHHFIAKENPRPRARDVKNRILAINLQCSNHFLSY